VIFLRIILIAMGLVVLTTFALFAIHWFLCQVDEAVFGNKSDKF